MGGRILDLGVSKRIWAHLGVSRRIWAYLGVCLGAVRAYLGVSIWAYLGVSGRCVGVSRRIWALCGRIWAPPKLGTELQAKRAPKATKIYPNMVQTKVPPSPIAKSLKNHSFPMCF